MIVKFSTSNGALTMHGDAAIALLKAMGHSGTVPGAILAADLPEALGKLRHALEAGKLKEPPSAVATTDDVDDDDDEERAPPVTLRKRAVPLLDMLETAIARESDLMWERG